MQFVQNEALYFALVFNLNFDLKKNCTVLSGSLWIILHIHIHIHIGIRDISLLS